ncbi:type I-E CRISPR-associated protein Cse1/CasA [Pluralibacter gergoviae]
MDLITEKWLPVTFASGDNARISLADLIDDRVIDVAWPRADFQGAAWQMLIGIMQCAVPPEDESDWKRIWKRGFAEGQWQAGLDALASALQFGPQKPAFLQSFDPLDSEPGPISGLLIDAPGGNTLKLNKDHFVKRGSVEAICPHCAAMALYTVQTNSPAGGAGYRVGLRGGGPMTTLVVPEDEASTPLWKKLWLNVACESAPAPAQHPLIFPWLAPTIVSDKPGKVVTPENAHPLQAYWGMPRRIEIDFATTRAGRCDLCGEHSEALLTQMRMKNYGVQYDGWHHPLSPYRKVKKDDAAPWLALKGQPGGLGYKDWVTLLMEEIDNFYHTQPAKVVSGAFRIRGCRLWCFAYDMDNAKARCWYQHRLPIVATGESKLVYSEASSAITLASDALFCLKKALKSALFDTPSEAKIDFSMTEIAFWQETEPHFHRVIGAVAGDPLLQHGATRAACLAWDKALHHYIVDVFDRTLLASTDESEKILMRKLAARQQLDVDYRKLKERKEWRLRAEEEKETQHDEQ